MLADGTGTSPVLADSSVERPAPVTYDRASLRAGIVHVGVGNFHRAHQAAVIDRLLRRGLAQDFAICGVGLLPGDVRARDAHRAQDGLYTLELRHPDGEREACRIGSIIDYLFAPENPEAVTERMAHPDTRIVSLTITEGGYATDTRSGAFLAGEDGIRHDLDNPGNPRTVFGFVIEALRRRRARGLPGFTVLSCDNLPDNGRVARNAFLAFAELVDPDLAQWMAVNVAFPHTMVDRITPATTEADIEYVRRVLGVDDHWPVVAESFFQWVIEDDFPAGRPDFEAVGVQVVSDVRPYELMKLRMLNGAHQAMAHLGSLAGYSRVDEAMADPALRRFVDLYMQEAQFSLPPVPGIDLDRYRRTLLERFSNPAIRDTLARLRTDASDRIPKFVVPAILDNLAAGRSPRYGAAVLAGWTRCLGGADDRGRDIEMIDRLRDELRVAADREREVPGSFLSLSALGGDLDRRPRFVEAYRSILDQFMERGARATYERLTEADARA